MSAKQSIYNFGQSFVRDLGLLVSVLVVVWLVLWRPDNFKDYGGILGAAIGTAGAYWVAMRSVDKTHAHAEQVRLDNLKAKRASLAVMQLNELRRWVDYSEEWLRKGETVPADQLVTNERLGTILNNCELFSVVTVHRILMANTARSMALHYAPSDRPRIDLRTSPNGRRAAATINLFNVSAIAAYCEMSTYIASVPPIEFTAPSPFVLNAAQRAEYLKLVEKHYEAVISFRIHDSSPEYATAHDELYDFQFADSKQTELAIADKRVTPPELLDSVPAGWEESPPD